MDGDDLGDGKDANGELTLEFLSGIVAGAGMSSAKLIAGVWAGGSKLTPRIGLFGFIRDRLYDAPMRKKA